MNTQNALRPVSHAVIIIAEKLDRLHMYNEMNSIHQAFDTE